MSTLILICIYIFIVLVGSFIPIGNEKSTVRRLPLVTFTIMAINVIVFSASFPVVAAQQEELAKLAVGMEVYLRQHEELLADENIRQQLCDIGMLTKAESELIRDQVKKSPELEAQYKEWLRGVEAQKLREEFGNKIAAFKTANQETVWSKYGLAGNGKWKPHQLITSAFLHAGLIHLFGNLIFFFAVAFSLEDLWGRSLFLLFYLMGAAAACIPGIVDPVAGPSLGASGAIAATLGAFMVRLPRAKIKLFVVPSVLRRIIGKKALVIMAPGYVYLASYFIAQIVTPYFDKKTGNVSNVGYSIHVAGFVFGACFALVLKMSKYEEQHINPKIEAMVSFSAAPAVNEALGALDKGDAVTAERKLRTHLGKNPSDTNALLAAIQVYQQTANYAKLNAMYARLIRLHLTNDDKEAALYAYDSLLSAFPDNNVAPKIPAQDWLTICEYLRESDMAREAAVEYERLVNACGDDPLISRAAVQGGEAALFVNDPERALRMFSKAEAMHASEPYGGRSRIGIERCQKILEARPNWHKKNAARKNPGNTLGGQKAPI